MSRRNSHSAVFNARNAANKCKRRKTKKEQEDLSAKYRVDAINEILRKRHKKYGEMR